LTRVQYVVVSIIIFKKICYLEFFLVKLYFYQSFKLSLNSSSQSDLIDSALTSLLLFKFEWNNFKLVYLWIWIEIMFVELIFWIIYIYIYINSTTSKRYAKTLWNQNIPFQLKKQNVNQNEIDNLDFKVTFQTHNHEKNLKLK